MKRALLNKWIEELKSGKWKQGKGQLHSIIDDTYCCLGVLCEIAGLEKAASGTYTKYFYKGSWDSGYLPAAFAGAQKVNYDAGLGRMNDRGVPFKEIAQELRCAPEKYMEVED